MLDLSLIFLMGLAGGLLPLLVAWTDRVLHSALSVSTGILLGAVFLHLLPSLSHLGAAPAAEGDHVHGAYSGVWFYVLVGVLAVYLIESLFFRTHDHDDLHRHKAVSYAALVGLSIHALSAGLSYEATTSQLDSARPMLIGMLAHKAFESFSLTSVLQLAKLPRRQIIWILALFSLVTPAGIVLGSVLMDALGPYGLAVVTALAAGTFLFVCLCELLPEVFHHREDILVKILLLVAGIGMMHLIQEQAH